MDTFIGVLAVVIICFILIFIMLIAIDKNEENEAGLFWECKTQGGTTDYCVDAFENDNTFRIERFKDCITEINDLGYCHTRFLLEFN